MEWMYLLMAYLPVISIVVGIVLLIVGIVMRRQENQLSKAFFIAGGLCVGICVLVGIALFTVGALGLGPVPN